MESNLLRLHQIQLIGLLNLLHSVWHVPLDKLGLSDGLLDRRLLLWLLRGSLTSDGSEHLEKYIFEVLVLLSPLWLLNEGLSLGKLSLW